MGGRLKPTPHVPRGRIHQEKAAEKGKGRARDRATEDSCIEGMSGDCECYGTTTVSEVQATVTWDGYKLDSPYGGSWRPTYRVVGIYDVTFKGYCQR